jgi:uncharacterized membrane protein
MSKLRKTYLLLLLLTLAWCVLIIVAPLLANAHHFFGAGFIYLFFSKMCHQCPDRSFLCLGKPFAVCARCTGIYLGFFFGALFYPFLTHKTNGGRIIIMLFAGLLLATMIDVTGNYLNMWQNNVWSRALLGGGIGILLACIIIPGILSIIKAKEELDGSKAR